MKINTEDLRQTRWRHVKRGLLYSVLYDTATLEYSSVPAFERLCEGVHWIVYRSDDTGHIWVRPRDEFLDGRFERVVEEEKQYLR